MIKEKCKTWSVISNGLGKIFSRLPLPANFYTWMTVPTGALGLWSVIQQHFILGIFWFILSGLLDIIDGGVARTRLQPTAYGAFLDGSVDRLVDFFVIFSYFWIPLKTPGLSVGPWVCLALFFAILPSFEVAYANHRKAVYDPHEVLIWRILNRGEMYPLMLAVILLSTFDSLWAGYCLITLVILSGITTLQTFFATLWLSTKR